MTDEQAMSAFGQGQAAARNGGFLSDNPHCYESEAWVVWREGWNCEKRGDAR